MRPPSRRLAFVLILSLPTLFGRLAWADSLVLIPARPLALPQTPLPAAPPTPQARTLAQALAILETPTQDLFLTVGADKITLPPETPPPDPDSRPGQVGVAYGRIVRDFGGVLALGPPTLVVLNTNPGLPSPYDGLPADEALKLLLAGLSPPQWDALTSENGLGAGDLSEDAQRGLFQAVLAAGNVAALPEYDPFIPSRSSEAVTLAPQDLDAARLRLGRRMQIGIPLAGATRTTVSYLAPPAPGVVGYDANNGPRARGETVYGAVLRQTLTNNPKDADLDYDAPALAQSVGVGGIVTVGDLVARVAQATGLEMYADRRYETRRVTLLGRRTARGVDLLRALAFCVTGTFRRVGPAYVLTDDLQGTLPRRQRLRRFVDEAYAARHAAVTAAGDSFATAHGGLDALPWVGGLGFSDAQQALTQFNQGAMSGAVAVPFAQLTPAQQAFVQDRADQVAQAGSSRDTRLDQGRQFTLQARPCLLLLSSRIPGPFFLENLSLYQIFQISFQSQMDANRRRAQEAAKKNLPLFVPLPPPLPALASALIAYPRRAVLAAPRTAREVDQAVAAMKALGLNQLWLDVFSSGHSHLGRQLTGNGGRSGNEPDILTEALARTKGTGIAVIPTLTLFRWGEDAPAEARDLTAQGETSVQQQAWQRHYSNALRGLSVSTVARPLPAEIWVSPAVPAVEDALRSLVRRLAATPGITTLALRDTVPRGYQHPPGSNSGIGPDDLGYVPALRLALLRRDHIDPLDLDGGYDSDTSLPEFDDIHSFEHSQALNRANQDWNALRDEASRDFLRRLLASAQDTSGHRFRFLVQQRGEVFTEGWYGLWDNFQAPLPEVPPPAPIDPRHPFLHPPWETNYAQVAHSRSRTALYALPTWAAPNPYIVADMLHRLKPGWDGVVLDTTSPLAGQSSSDALADLARDIRPALPKPLPSP